MQPKYNLTGNRNFYGIQEPITYYDVKQSDVQAKCQYMAETYKLPTVLTYPRNKDKTTTYVGSYSAKYKNFRINGSLYKTF